MKKAKRRIVVWSGTVKDCGLLKLGDAEEPADSGPGTVLVASHRKLYGLGTVRLVAECVEAQKNPLTKRSRKL